jgi:hypothetical protein
MYAMVGTQFNITFCIGLLRRYLAALTSHHLRTHGIYEAYI